jgi:hypothetical protein
MAKFAHRSTGMVLRLRAEHNLNRLKMFAQLREDVLVTELAGLATDAAA